MSKEVSKEEIEEAKEAEAPQFNVQQLQALLQFLNRAQYQGSEMPAYVDVVNTANSIIEHHKGEVQREYDQRIIEQYLADLASAEEDGAEDDPAADMTDEEQEAYDKLQKADEEAAANVKAKTEGNRKQRQAKGKGK